jgi:hypothetical protein
MDDPDLINHISALSVDSLLRSPLDGVRTCFGVPHDLDLWYIFPEVESQQFSTPPIYIRDNRVWWDFLNAIKHFGLPLRQDNEGGLAMGWEVLEIYAYPPGISPLDTEDGDSDMEDCSMEDMIMEELSTSEYVPGNFAGLRYDV